MYDIVFYVLFLASEIRKRVYMKLLIVLLRPEAMLANKGCLTAHCCLERMERESWERLRMTGEMEKVVAMA